MSRRLSALCCCVAFVANADPTGPDERKFARVGSCKVRGATMKGDPVIVSGFNTMSFEQHEDVTVEMPTGSFSFSRRFISDTAALGQVESALDSRAPLLDFCSLSVLHDSSPPFGASNANFTHSLQSLVDTRCVRVTRVLTPDGDVRFFGAVPALRVGEAAWVPRRTGEGAGEPSRLLATRLVTGLTFTWHAESGEALDFGSVDNSGVYRLVEARDAQDVRQYRVSYTAVCGQAQPASVRVGEAQQEVQLSYSACALRMVSLGNRPFVTYAGAVATFPESLTPGGWVDTIGLKSMRQTQVVNGVQLRPPEDAIDCPTCEPLGFVSSEVRHVHTQVTSGDGPKILFSAEGWGGAMRTAFSPLGPEVAPTPGPQCTTTTRTRSTSTSVAGGSAGSTRTFAWGSVTPATDFLEAAGLGATYEPLPMSVEKTCTNFSDPTLCTPGITEFVYGRATPDGLSVDLSCGDAAAPTSLVAVRDEANAFRVTPSAFTPQAGGNFEQRAEYAGATTPHGTSALSTLFRTYGYAGDRQELRTEEEPSALQSGARAVTTRQYDTAGRLEAIIRSGYTRRGDATVLEHRATFFHHGTRCSGVVDGVTSDRVTSVVGPCGVSGPGATACDDASNALVTDLYYYDSRVPPPGGLRFPQPPTQAFNDGRLALARTFPNGCGGSSLDTRYGSYTAEGRPEFLVGPDAAMKSSVSTGMLITHASGAAEAALQTGTDFSWDRGKLQKVQLPNGDVWRVCYAARTVAELPPAEQFLYFPSCPLVGNTNNGFGVTGNSGHGNGNGSSGGVFHGNGGVGNGNGSGNGNGGVGQGNGNGNVVTSSPLDRMGEPLWVGRFSADGQPREHYSFQYSADRTLARVEFFDEPLPSGAYGPGPTFYFLDAQGAVTRVKPLWRKDTRTDSERQLIAASVADRIPSALERDARGDVVSMGAGFDFASPTLPAQVSCFAGGNGLCKQLVRDRLGRVAAYVKRANAAGAARAGADVLTYDAQGNVSSYSRGCPITAATASPVTTVAEGSDGSLSVVGMPSCSAVPVSFVHDDFGELVSVTEVIGTTPAETRFEYDTRGQLLRRRTAEQRRSPDAFAGTYHSFDALGRELRVTEWPPTHGAALVQRVFDEVTLPPGCEAIFGAPTFTQGRLALEAGPVWNVFSSYNQLGQVTGELRLHSALTACPARESADMVLTRFTYGYRGRLEEVRYPWGRRVRYRYPPARTAEGLDVEKPLAIDVEVFGVAGVSFVPMVTDIRWTRDGLLKSYRAHTFSQPSSGPLQFGAATFSHTVLYDYAGGLDAESPPQSCTSVPSSTSDGTRRLRRITTLSDSQGVLSQEWYSWRAEQLISVERCYSGMTAPLTLFRNSQTVRGFDAEGQLVASDIPPAGAVPSASRTFGYDARGNRTFVGFGPVVPGQANGTANVLSGDLLESTTAARIAGFPLRLSDTRDVTRFGYDFDGRVVTRTTAQDSRGVPNSTTRFTLPYAALPSHGGDGAVIRAVSIDGLSFNYFYDGSNRRVRKQHPTGAVEDFLYGPGKQLLAERSFAFAHNADGNVVDEYLWLGGSVIAVLRTPFTGDMTRAGEWRGFPSADGPVCHRRNEASRCGLYWVTPDFWGRPMLAVDQNHKLSGVGEYDAFGTLNRVEAQRETPHPVADGAAFVLAQGTTRPRFALGLRARVRAAFVDTEVRSPCGAFPSCTGSVAVSVTSPTRPLYSALLVGFHGPLVTPWFQADEAFDVSMSFGGASDGAALRAWDYQRVSPPDGTERTSLQYFPPLRFPGQYFDEETDLHENWNRFYDASLGRYLSPEPLTQSPVYLRRIAQGGMSVPTYAYAANNPLRYVDPDGLSPKSRLRLIKDFRFWVDFMTRHHLRRMPPLLNNFNATSPFRKELGCGDQADWLRRRLAEEGPYEDFQIGLAGGRTSSSGAWPHQWIVAVSTVDNSVLALDPWADRVTESPWFDNADTYDWDLTGGNYPDAMGGPWESVPTYGPWPSSSSEAPPWW